MSSIGPVIHVPTLGRTASVVGATPTGETADGRQTVQVHYRARVACDEAGAAGVPTVSTGVEYARESVRAVRESGACEDCEDTGRQRKDLLTAEERAALDKLRQIDAQVKQEEKAHAAMAGAAGGPIRYKYATGPDGRQYAVGGKVPVDFSNPSGDPERARTVASRIATAANAAANPSAADLTMARRAYDAAGSAAATAFRNFDGRG